VTHRELDELLEHVREHRNLHCTSVLCSMCVGCILCDECVCPEASVLVDPDCDGEDLLAREDQDE
jgi:hypothetical protein